MQPCSEALKKKSSACIGVLSLLLCGLLSKEGLQETMSPKAKMQPMLYIGGGSPQCV